MHPTHATYTRRPTGPRRDYLYFIALSLFAIAYFLSIALVKFGIPGLPLRAALAVLILAITFVASPWIFVDSILSMSKVLRVILLCATFAISASLLNGVTADVLARQILEIHVQAMISTIVGACLLRICGPSAVIKVTLFCIGTSGAFAILQFLGVGSAWELRNIFQRLQPIEMDADSIFLTQRMRAMGLSFSPVHLGTQICLAFAGWFALLLGGAKGGLRKTLTPKFYLGLAVFLAVALASGNRSPIVGLIVFLIAYLSLTRPALAVIIIITALPALVVVDDLMQDMAEAGLRIARTDDGSSNNRKVLRTYGFLLFLDRPYGYGLSFNSTEHWAAYWERLKNYPNPLAITYHALHNYYMMILNKYGAPILLVAAYVGVQFSKNVGILFAFIPYMIHIFFHNDGPMQGDFLIWFMLPSIFFLSGIPADRGGRARRELDQRHAPLSTATNRRSDVASYRNAGAK